MREIKTWIAKYSKEILIGIIVSLLTAGIIKGLEWVKEVAPIAGNSFLNLFLDLFYRNLARISDNSLLLAIFSIILVCFMGSLFNIVQKGFSVAQESIAWGKKMKELLADKENGTVKESVSKEKKNRTSKEIAENNIKDGKKLKRYSAFCFIFFIMYILYFFCFHIVPVSMWDVYKRDITKITPYVEQEEIDMIQSNWCCMKNKEDFDDIYEIINEVKEKHNLS